jgi:hypothetical protein
MADRYFQLCTAEEFRSATGQLFNDKLEAMYTQPGQAQADRYLAPPALRAPPPAPAMRGRLCGIVYA